MTPAERMLLLATACKALIPHAEAELHRQADARIRDAMAAVEVEAYGEPHTNSIGLDFSRSNLPDRGGLRRRRGDQCADTDGLAAARDPMRVDGEMPV